MNIKIKINYAIQTKTLIIESEEIEDQEIDIDVPQETLYNKNYLDNFIANYLKENDYFEFTYTPSNIIDIEDNDIEVDYTVIEQDNFIIYYFTEKDQTLPFKEKNLYFPKLIIIEKEELQPC